MEVCVGPLWDSGLTWYTSDPDFTPCFHLLVLPSVPLAFLLAVSPLELYFLYSAARSPVPWCYRNLARLLLTSLMSILSLLSLVLTLTSSRTLSMSDIISPAVELSSLLLAGLFSWLNIRRGVLSSGILFTFWTVKTLCQTFTFASVVRDSSQTIQNHYDLVQVSSVPLFYLQFSAGLALFFLHFWADPQPADKFAEGDKPLPEISASFPNKMTFSWISGLLITGWKRPLTSEDLYDLNATERCANVSEKWMKNWNKLANKRYSRKPVNVLLPMLQTFGLYYLLSSALQLLSVLFNQLTPQALNLLIGFISSGEEQWKGYLYMILLVALKMIVILLNSQYFLQQLIIGLRMRSALTSAIFNKSFKLTSKSRRERSLGESVNLMQIDSQRLMDVIQNLNLLWSSPLTIILSMYSLWGLLGAASLAGLFVMVLLIPTNAALGSRMKKFQRENMKFKDNRMKSMNEILDGIKVLKLYAWEPSFQAQVSGIRETEVSNLKKLAYMQAVQRFIFSATPFFVAIASFATFVLMDPNNILDAQIAFVSLSYFNIMRNPLTSLPNLIVQMIQAQVSIDRVNKYLNSTEINRNMVTNNEEGDTVLRISNGSFTWDEGSPPVLEKINLEVQRNQLVAVVGQVGSGKSSLLSAVINDLTKTVLNAEINVNGSISYVPQQAWMQNATLRHNIMFGKEYERLTYNKVVAACALEPDLQILPSGDQTEIGEKGINLSGGQKQRISLARSVYNDGDIYLLDDPLSAVDAHVGKHLFDNVIGPGGLLRDKTRVLVTHSVRYLPLVDKIVVMKDGRISEVGTYKGLLDQGKDFASFLIQYIQEEEDKLLEGQDTEGLQLVKADLVSKMGQKTVEKEVKIAKSRSSVTSRTSESRRGRSVEEKSVTESTEKTPMQRGAPRRRNYGAADSRTGDKEETRGEKRGGKRGGGDRGKLMTSEFLETKAVNKAVYSFYFKAVGLQITVYILLLNIIQQALSIGTNVWLSEWSDDPKAGEVKMRNIYLSVYGVLGVLTAVVFCVVNLVTALGGLNASTLLHDKMVSGVLRAPMSFFDTNPKGRIVNRFAKDIDMVDSSIPLTFAALMRLGLGVVGTIVVICTTEPYFIAIIIPISFLYYMVQRFYVSSSRQLRRIESSSRSPIYSWFGESVSGVTTVKAYKMEEQFSHEMQRKVDTNGESMVPNYMANRWLSIRLEMLGNLIVLFAALLAVLGRDTLEPGLVGLSLSYAMQITGSLNMLIRQSSQIENNMVSVERIKEYQHSLPHEADWTVPGDPGPDQWPLSGEISLNNLQMRYREGLPLVLKGVSLHISPGQRVGIVGRTGSGKSSLTLSIFRITEATGGTITIDGLDISGLGLGTLRSGLTIIPQDPVLFSGSLRMNLDPFSAHSDKELWTALEVAHLKSYVSSLPGALHYNVAEGGGNLSVGQRQLVCLARACLRKTKILLLDEATAAVDLETDDLIQATIRSEFSSCTILTIAHRLNTIMDSDRVVVMDDGHVTEFDSPDNLLQKEGSAFLSMAREAGLAPQK